MSVHLFGAVSLPACANFALLKMAEDNSQHFSADVISTVRGNFYVDDCLKSLPSAEDTIAHVSELRSLLQRGGFRERAQTTKEISLEHVVERALGVQ